MDISHPLLRINFLKVSGMCNLLGHLLHHHVSRNKINFLMRYRITWAKRRYLFWVLSDCKETTRFQTSTFFNQGLLKWQKKFRFCLLLTAKSQYSRNTDTCNDAKILIKIYYKGNMSFWLVQHQWIKTERGIINKLLSFFYCFSGWGRGKLD